MLRACYRTRMRFYSERTDVQVWVRWFFVPHNTPACPHVTTFNSRNWLDDERDPWPAMGEVEGAPREFVDGSAPAQVLALRPCGPVSAFTVGVPFPPDPPITPAVWGLPLCCIPGGTLTCPTLPAVIDSVDAVSYALSVACFAVQVGDAALVDIMGDVLVRVATSNVSDLASTTIKPRWAAWWNAEQALVVIGGTVNESELLLELLQSVLGAVDQGGFSSSQYAGAAAHDVYVALSNAGFPIDVPVTFAGYSAGGSIASWLCARERQFRPTRVSKCVTFGEPKTGDTRLRALLRGHMRRFETSGDIVPSLPPDFSTFLWILGIVGIVVGNRWASFTRSALGERIFSDGTIAQAFDEEAGFAALSAILAEYLAGDPLDVGNIHRIGVYCNRLFLAVALGDPALPAVCLDLTTVDQVLGQLQSMVPPEEFRIDVFFQSVSAGAADMQQGFSIPTTGNTVSAGAAIIWSSLFLPSSGAGVTIGTALITSGVDIPSSGGGVSVGHGAIELGTVITSDGGGVAGGEAEWPSGLIIMSDGGGIAAGGGDMHISAPPLVIDSSGGGVAGGAALFMVPMIFDDFTDVDGTPLHDHTMNMGLGWSNNPNYEVVTDSVFGNFPVLSIITQAPSADGYLQCTLQDAVGLGLAVRATTEDTHWWISTRLKFGGLESELCIFFVPNAAPVLQASIGLGSILTTHTLSVLMQGDKVTAEVNGIKLELTDSFNNTGAFVGLFNTGGPGAGYDDFIWATI